MPIPPELTFRVGAVLLDIEGTISSQAHVATVMFPYARARLAGFVADHRDDPRVAAILAETLALAGHDGDPVEVLRGWIDEDRKAPPLKTLQGMIWDRGFRDGALQGHVFADALAALETWRATGIPLFVYSSGSVAAQRLFFEFNVGGDLRPLFAGLFDTDIGSKLEPESYGRIAATIGHRPADVVFLSDHAGELDAARAAGLAVVQVVRDRTVRAERFAAITDFAELDLRSA